MTKVKKAKKPTPAAKKAPVTKAATTKASAPKKKAATPKKTTTLKKAPTAKKAPAAKKTPATKKAPALKKPSAAKKAPATKKAPAAKKAPTSKKALAAKKTSTTKPAPAVKKVDAKHQESSLQQTFFHSLDNLEKYWHTKVDNLKKQAEHAKLFDENKDMESLRSSLDEAINQANKYSALQDMISEFEHDWSSQTILANSSDKPAKTGKKEKTASTSTSAAPLLVASSLATEINEMELEEDPLLEEIDDELVNEFEDETASELEFADDSAAFFPEDDLFDEDTDDYAN